MRTLVLLTVAICATVCSSAPNPIPDIVRYITREGYPVQNLSVQTTDGYMLDLIRIPGPTPNAESDKPVVLLMHGLLGSADEFVVGGKTRGLAFKLADRGFDVFMGNARGSRYGRKHTSLDPDTDPQFWRYTWNEIGLLDLPAIIGRVETATGQSKMHYIGYNQGNTALYVLTSRRPQYNSKIRKMIALGPMVYMEHAHHPLMSIIRTHRKSPSWVAKHIGSNEFSPSRSLKNDVEPDCINKQIDQQVCENFYFLVNGYSRNFNQSIVPQLSVDTPYGISSRQLLHYAQLIDTGNFGSYDNSDNSYSADSKDSSSDSDSDSDSDSNSSSSSSSSSDSADNYSTKYDLKAVTLDNYLLYVPDDAWYNRQDINKLANDLPNVKENHQFRNYQSNVDLLIAKDAYSTVHQKILNILQ